MGRGRLNRTPSISPASIHPRAQTHTAPQTASRGGDRAMMIRPYGDIVLKALPALVILQAFLCLRSQRFLSFHPGPVLTLWAQRPYCFHSLTCSCQVTPQGSLCLLPDALPRQDNLSPPWQPFWTAKAVVMVL